MNALMWIIAIPTGFAALLLVGLLVARLFGAVVDIGEQQ